MDIVTTWREIEKSAGKSFGQAVEDLATATGLYADTSLARKWQQGGRRIPPAAYEHMVGRVLYATLQAEGVSITYQAAGRVFGRLQLPG